MIQGQGSSQELPLVSYPSCHQRDLVTLISRSYEELRFVFSCQRPNYSKQQSSSDQSRARTQSANAEYKLRLQHLLESAQVQTVAVELTGIEPVTPGLQSRCSPS